MHRDAKGRLHITILVHGPWSNALDDDLRWLTTVPSGWKRQCIDWQTVWFSQVQIVVTPTDLRPEIVQFHVAGMTGSLWSDELELHLLAHADGIVFVATNVEFRLETALVYRRHLDDWIGERRDAAFVVFQLDDPEVKTVFSTYPDRPSTTETVEPVSVERLREELRVGDRPCFVTKAREFVGIKDVYRAISRMLYDAAIAGKLVERPLLAPIVPLG